MQQNNIIDHTASRVALNNQLEVFLKVKQANNPNFAFFNAKDELHEYYLFLRGKYRDQSIVLPKEEGRYDGNDVNGDNPLSCLLGGYSSSFSEESVCPSEKIDESGMQSSDARGATDENKDLVRSEEQERKRKADRLVRLRIWKESRSS